MNDNYKENILDLVHSYMHPICKRKDTKSIITFRVDKETKNLLVKMADVLGTSPCRLGSDLFVIAFKEAFACISKVSKTEKEK